MLEITKRKTFSSAVALMRCANRPGHTPATAAREGTPFELVMITITKQEHVGLVLWVNCWKSDHQRRLVRSEWLQVRNQKQLEIDARAEAALRRELGASTSIGLSPAMTHVCATTRSPYVDFVDKSQTPEHAFANNWRCDLSKIGVFVA